MASIYTTPADSVMSYRVTSSFCVSCARVLLRVYGYRLKQLRAWLSFVKIVFYINLVLGRVSLRHVVFVR